MKSITVLKLKLTGDHSESLIRIASLCRKGRNAGIEDWLLRQRGKPESERQSKRLIARKDAQDKPKSESTKIYHAIREAVPELGTTQASMVAASINSQLAAKVDWRRGNAENGKRLKRRDAILAYDDRPPFYTSLEIPLHNRQVMVRFSDKLSISVVRPVDDIQLLQLDLSLKQLTAGHKLLLHDITNGERKLADSKLVEKDGDWYWHLPIAFDTEVSSEITATLWPTIGSEKSGKQADRPFYLDLPKRTWYIGDGMYLLAQTERLIGLRKMIGWRYRQRLGAGHGRKKIDAAIRKRREQERNVRNEVRRRAIADVVRQCVRHKCGIVVYREPTGPVRSKCWFKANGLDWDWTRFRADLINACARQGIEVCVTSYKWQEAIGEEPKKAAV